LDKFNTHPFFPVVVQTNLPAKDFIILLEEEGELVLGRQKEADALVFKLAPMLFYYYYLRRFYMGKEIAAAMIANDAKVRSTLADYLQLSEVDRAADGALTPFVTARCDNGYL
jgi:hypothetical protein